MALNESGVSFLLPGQPLPSSRPQSHFLGMLAVPGFTCSLLFNP